jgi:hypothetical protein
LDEKIFSTDATELNGYFSVQSIETLSRKFVIKGGMKISRKDAKLAKFLFFTLRLCAFA